MAGHDLLHHALYSVGLEFEILIKTQDAYVDDNDRKSIKTFSDKFARNHNSWTVDGDMLGVEVIGSITRSSERVTNFSNITSGPVSTQGGRTLSFDKPLQEFRVQFPPVSSAYLQTAHYRTSA
ncbi:MAG: hypothetical protein Q9159_003757 [Coniocarpon cinnabarinum]